MKNKIEIFQIDAFTSIPFQGNPAAVVFENNLTVEEMKFIAREMNLAETAFLSNSDKGDYNIRWFSPTTEVELCGHATIAALHFLKEKKLLNDNRQIQLNSLSGLLKCYYEQDKYYMQIPSYKISLFNGNIDEIKNALGIDQEIFNENIPPVILENGNLYIYLKTLSELAAVKPNFTLLEKLTALHHEFEGICLFTLETVEENNFAHIRYFAPFYGINEDIVTGSANGPLLPVLVFLGLVKKTSTKNIFTFEQGDFLKRKGRVTVQMTSDGKLFIAGNAVTILKGEIFY